MPGSAGEEVFMNVPAVRGIAATFGTIGDVLRNVAKAIEILSTTLKTTAFIGNIGGAALAEVLDVINPRIKEIAKKCTELKKDLSASVDAYERGDALGATRFH